MVRYINGAALMGLSIRQTVFLCIFILGAGFQPLHAQEGDYYALPKGARRTNYANAFKFDVAGLLTGMATLAYERDFDGGGGLMITGSYFLPYFRTGFLLSDYAYNAPVSFGGAKGGGGGIYIKGGFDANTIGVRSGYGFGFDVSVATFENASSLVAINPGGFYFLERQLTKRVYVELQTGLVVGWYSFVYQVPGFFPGDEIPERKDKIWANPFVKLNLGFLL